MDMGKKIRIRIAIASVACLCAFSLQAQEVKSISLDTIPKTSLPQEVMTPNISRPTLGGFPILSGSSYYSESKDEVTLKIAPNAIPHYTLPSVNIGPLAAYSFSTEVPGLMDKQTVMFVYHQDLGRFAFSPYVGVQQVKMGAYRLGYFIKLLLAAICLIK